ncbi:MAG: DUF1552 domain-containing protein [Deltaproteobacteria bacterium]|nr:DUF1552 domain-containing protein [Deltaproteobacteria bacterium]
MKRLHRRTVLRGAGGVALALPFLDAMRPNKALAQNAPPRRVMFVFKANGNEHATRFKTAGVTDYELGEFLEPLEPYRKEMLLLNGIDKFHGKVPGLERADAHQQGGAGLAPWKSGSGSFPIGGVDRTIGYVEGPSADFVLGERVLAANPTVKHRHLVYRVGGFGNNIWNVHSHGGPVGKQNPITPEVDPFKAYARIFSFKPLDPAAELALRRQFEKRKSGIDLVRDDGKSLKARLGSADQRKLEQHLQSIADIERSLQQPGAGAVGAGCKPVTQGATFDAVNDKNHAMAGALFFKLSAMAFACDLTRVVNFAWGGNTNGRVYDNLGIAEGHHDISHNSDAAAFAKIRTINRYLWTQSIKLHEELKAIPEGDGTVWDNTLVVHWNELGQGDKHSTDNDLVILTGGAQKHFQMGRLLEIAKKSSFSDMLVSVFHYMGFTDLTTFGDPRMGTNKPVPGLTA